MLKDKYIPPLYKGISKLSKLKYLAISLGKNEFKNEFLNNLNLISNYYDS